MKRYIERIAIFFMILTILLPTGAISAQAATADSSVYEYRSAFSADHAMTGLYSQMSESFETGNWRILDATLTVEYAATPFIQSQKADLTFYLNGEAVSSIPITKSKGERETVKLRLPVKSILPGTGNSLTMEAYIRSSVDECVDDTSRANWVNIFRESSLSIRYIPVTPCTNIAEFYQCFTSLEAASNRQSAMLVPKDPNTQELTALAASYGFSSKLPSGEYESLPLRSISDTKELEGLKYGIYISQFQRLLPQVKAAMTKQQQEQAQKDPVLALIKLGKTHLLVITGPKDLTAAGIILSNAQLMSQLRSKTKAVSKDESYLMPSTPVAQYVKLTETGEYAKGGLRRTVESYIEYPKNRTLAGASEISLDFRYSDQLDFTRSLVTVMVNNEPVASKQLTKANSQADHLQVTLPKNLKITGSFTVKLVFDLSAGDNWCKLTPEEMPWAYVMNSSMLKLNSSDQSDLLFENYPSPLVRDGSLDHLVVLLPNQPSEAELTAMHRVMMLLGRSVRDNRGSVRVAFTSQPGDLKEENIISIGIAGRNLLQQQKQKLLPFQFSQNGSTVLSNSKMLVEKGYGSTLGVGQLIESPYSGDLLRAVLVISGANDAALLQATKYLGTEEGLWKISGNAFAADEKQAFSYQFEGSGKSSVMPAKKAPEDSGKTSIQVWLAISLFLLAAISAGILLVKYRRKRPL